MTKKYELTTNTKLHLGRTLYQIKALISFRTVSAGTTLPSTSFYFNQGKENKGC